MSEKDRRLGTWCRKHGWDGVLIRRRSNVAWATDGAAVFCSTSTGLAVATLLWTPEKKLVLTDNVEGPRLAVEEFRNRDWEVRQRSWWEQIKIPRGSFATDYPEDCLTALRASLTAGERERVHHLGAEAAEAVSQVAKNVRPGQSEQEIAGELSARLRRQGILSPVVLIGADERIERFRHPVPTSNRLEKALMIVLCAERHGLIVALTRLVHFGRLPDELRRRHEAVCRVDAVYHAATAVGARWCDVLDAGVAVYRELGFADEWQKHFQGGPMGYECRDYWATPSETRCVVENQVVGWNPSIAGTKSEDTILSTGEVITETADWPMCGSRPHILCRLPV